MSERQVLCIELLNPSRWAVEGNIIIIDGQQQFL